MIEFEIHSKKKKIESSSYGIAHWLMIYDA